jgi:hypothetical protein
MAKKLRKQSDKLVTERQINTTRLQHDDDKSIGFSVKRMFFLLTVYAFQHNSSTYLITLNVICTDYSLSATLRGALATMPLETAPRCQIVQIACTKCIEYQTVWYMDGSREAHQLHQGHWPPDRRMMKSKNYTKSSSHLVYNHFSKSSNTKM